MTDNKSRITRVESPGDATKMNVSGLGIQASNSSMGIQAPHIDRVDDINKSGTLEGITFYQGPSARRDSGRRSMSGSGMKQTSAPGSKILTKQQAHELEKSLELSLLDSDSDEDRPERTKEYVEKIIKDNEMIGSVLITTGRLYDRESPQSGVVSEKVSHGVSVPHVVTKPRSGSRVSDTPLPIAQPVAQPVARNIPMTQSATQFVAQPMTQQLSTHASAVNIPVATPVSKSTPDGQMQPSGQRDPMHEQNSGQRSENIVVRTDDAKSNPDETSVDASLILDSDNVNLLYYSHFFELDDKHKKFVLNIKDLIREMCIVLFFHLFLGIHNAIFNVITIDGILSCIIFYMSFVGVEDKNNFLLKNRLMTLDRYIYYLLLFCGYYLFNYMTWFKFTGFAMYIASIMICPSIMGQIYDIYAYKKIRQVLYDGYNRLVQKIICKQLSKIINIVIKNVLNINITVGYEDLIPFYSQFSWLIINKFIVTFILACIFNHVDKGSMKFPMMIYKNLYMKDSKYNIADDKLYLRKVIEDKQYAKFMDVYTLNRIIRMVVNDDTQNSMLSEQVTTFLQKVFFKINRVMFCWTLMSISNLTIGVLGFFLFISTSERPMRYLINTLFFTLLSFFTDERLLVIILCEICYPIVDSKLLTDVMDDTYQSLKRGFLNLYYRTRLESVLLSICLTYLSYCAYNNFGILAVGALNLIVMLRLYTSAEFLSGNLFVRPKPDTHSPKLLPKLANTSESSVARLIQYPAKLLASGITGQTTGIAPSLVPGSMPTTQGSANSGTPVVTQGIVGGIALHDSALEFEEALRSSSPLQGADSSAQRRHRSKIIARVPTQADKMRTQVKGIKPIHGIDTFDESAIDADALAASSAQIHRIESIDDIQNRDILLIIRDRIKVVLKNNLLIKVINPFKKVEVSAVLRIFAHLFLLLILGYISNFSTLHIILLPIMVQNVIDIIV